VRKTDAVFRRIAYILLLPFMLLGAMFLIVLSPFTWIATGKSIDDQGEWFEDKWGDVSRWAGVRQYENW